jgi:hypothetical protein
MGLEENMSRSRRSQIRADLLDQLSRNGTVGQYYTDLVDDYMRLWDVKKGLIDDIASRGAKVTVQTANASNIKTNDSVIDLLKTNAQMLKLLDSLGITPAPADGDPGDDEM